MFKNMVENISLSLMFAVMVISCLSFVPLSAAAEMTIEPLEMDVHSLKLLTISGSADITPDAELMVSIVFPGGLVQNHIAKIANDGNSFVYYVRPNSDFQPGTFTINIYNFINSRQQLLDSAVFNIYDADFKFDITIDRGAGAKACNGCTDPLKTTLLENSILTIHNNDSVLHDIELERSDDDSIGLLNSGESKTIVVEGSRTKKYACTIHPWVNFEIEILKNKYGFPIRELVVPEPELELDETSLIDESEKNDKDLEKNTDESGKNNDKETTTPANPESVESPTFVIPSKASNTKFLKDCKSCVDGIVNKIVDGDTLDIDGIRIRLALVDTPERGESGYSEATSFTKLSCPVGSTAYYDIDLKQPVGSYGRTIAEVFCDGQSLNEQLLVENHAVVLVKYCSSSEYETSDWAQKYGCGDGLTGVNATDTGDQNDGIDGPSTLSTNGSNTDSISNETLSEPDPTLTTDSDSQDSGSFFDFLNPIFDFFSSLFQPQADASSSVPRASF